MEKNRTASSPIPYVDGETLDPTVVEIFASLQKSVGMVPSIYRVMAHAPAILEASQTWTRAITKTQALRIKEIAYIRTSALNRCAYCLIFHRKLGVKAGLNEDQLGALEEIERTDWSAFGPAEQNIIRFAQAWTLRQEIPTTLIDELQRDLGPGGLVVLAATVHQANWTNRFSNLFVAKKNSHSDPY